MPIKCLTLDSAIDEWVEDFVGRKNHDIIRDMCYVGEQCINQARSVNSYKDQTGNLRSSIGYVVVEDGNIIQMSSFETVPPKNPKQGDKYTGSEDGKSFAKELASQYPSGICLIVVAGMKYATYVSAKGLDVLDSAELLADKEVSKILKKLGFK